MEIVRDDLWSQCLIDAMKMNRVDEPNEKCRNLADATWKMKMTYRKFDEKKQSRQVIVLDKTPVIVKEARASTHICQATTMTGKRCSFKAVCGDFCKKHRIDKGTLGSKIKIGV